MRDIGKYRADQRILHDRKMLGAAHPFARFLESIAYELAGLVERHAKDIDHLEMSDLRPLARGVGMKRGELFGGEPMIEDRVGFQRPAWLTPAPLSRNAFENSDHPSALLQVI